MKLKLTAVALPLREVFTISRGSLSTQHAVVVELSHDGETGLGEVTANTFYGHSLAAIIASIESVRELVEGADPHAPEVLWNALQTRLPQDSFAVCALDLAAHDLNARLHRQRLLDLWNLSDASLSYSSYTIPIDSNEGMLRRLNSQPNWPCYKIKLGTDHDLEIVQTLRAHTDATLRVDANCAWTAEQTVALSKDLMELGVEFIEQPLRQDATEADKRFVFEHSALPIVADEDCQVEADVRRCRGLFHGVNVKLCKCGGLTPALRMLREARELGLKTMVGCMVESSVGISAAAQLLPLLDYADLDGAVLLADEPATGVRIVSGRAEFPAGVPGTGARLLKDRLPRFEIDPARIDYGIESH